ncbi:MAG: alpha/beta fold hydrolase [Chloroflexi bacterium]|nr:alpha/beta fold hydrolase [Chloroflexota bacterium]
MKKENNIPKKTNKQSQNIQWLPILLVAWNIIDAGLHISIGFVDPVRIAGNIVGVVAAIIVLLGLAKSYAPHALGLGAALIVILNAMQPPISGFLGIVLLTFIGGSVFLLLRSAQLKYAEASIRNDHTDAPIYFRGWVALLVTLVGLAIIYSVGRLIDPPQLTGAVGPAPCLENVEVEIMKTEAGVEFVRTPDACFENLLDWPYEPKYVEIDGMRQAYIDVGPADAKETILLLHGQPSWLYLYRDMIPVLEDAGYRVIAMDHIGMGRSDKPIDPEFYTYMYHVSRLETFIQELELEGITVFVQDWGSLIGLDVIGLHPDWFDRVVVGNGDLPTWPEGHIPLTLPEDVEAASDSYFSKISQLPARQIKLRNKDGEFSWLLKSLGGDTEFGAWAVYSLYDERFTASQSLELGTYFALTPDELAAYDAPFPSRLFMGGPRTFPSLASQLPGVTLAGWDGLGEYEKPFLTIWGNNDLGGLGSPETQQRLLDHIPGSNGWDHVRLPKASHFLQDDQGPEIARIMIEFIEASSSGD